MTCHLPCRCVIDSIDDAVDVEYLTEECTSEGLVEAICFAPYCKPCADKAIKEWGAKITQYDENGTLIDQWSEK